MAFLGRIRAFAGGLLLIVLLPVLLLLAAISRPFFKNKHRQITPAEFANLLRRVGDDTIGDEWDEFECVSLRDERLEDIKYKAFPFCGRPGAVDRKALYALAAEAEALPPLSE